MFLVSFFSSSFPFLFFFAARKFELHGVLLVFDYCCFISVDLVLCMHLEDRRMEGGSNGGTFGMEMEREMRRRNG
jgi:hypothetical protein